MRSLSGARLVPAWVLLLLMAVAAAVAVPPARPAPAPSRFEGQRPAVCQSGEAPSRAHVAGQPAAGLSVEGPPPRWLSPAEDALLGVGHGDPPLERPLASPFALHQRPPPAAFHG